jgi:hypothetical protein
MNSWSWARILVWGEVILGCWDAGDESVAFSAEVMEGGVTNWALTVADRALRVL